MNENENIIYQYLFDAAKVVPSKKSITVDVYI